MQHMQRNLGLLTAVGTFWGILAGITGQQLYQLVLELPAPISSPMKHDAPGLLVLVTITLVAVAGFAASLQAAQSMQGRHRRSQARRLAVIALLIVEGLLTSAANVLSNVFTNRNATAYVALFIGVIVLATATSVVAYLVQSAPPVEVTNRRNFLRKLQRRYSLRQEDALQGAALLALGLQPASVGLVSSQMVVGTLSNERLFVPTRDLAPTTNLVEIFNAAGGELLVLGTPGSGKTTLLVGLGLELVRQAQTDGRAALPVLFNLSSWAINRRPLESWLIEDLTETYQVPRRVARDWVRTEQLQLLLDGLDEVVEDTRAKCIEAVNAFHAAHTSVKLVVCSRIAEYRAQSQPLAITTAVEIQPLSEAQVDTYLAAGGESLAGLRQAIADDSGLREIVRIPLFLSLVTLTYHGLAVDAIPPVHDGTSWRQRLLQDYVARMLEHTRGLEESAAYTPEEAEGYLSWLALQMRRHGLTEFFLERMQPDWLPSAAAYRRYRLLIGIICGLLLGGVSGLLVGLLVLELTAGSIFRLMFGLTAVLIVGLCVGVLGVLAGAVAFGYGTAPTYRLRIDSAGEPWSWSAALRGGLVFGVGAFLLIGLAGTASESIARYGRIAALPDLLVLVRQVVFLPFAELELSALIICVAAVLLFGQFPERVTGLRGGIFAGLLIGPGCGAFVVLVVQSVGNIVVYRLPGYITFSILSTALLGGLLLGTLAGHLTGPVNRSLSRRDPPIFRRWSWQGALRGGTVTGLLLGGFWSLLFALELRNFFVILVVGVIAALLYGLGTGVMFGALGDYIVGTRSGLVTGILLAFTAIPLSTAFFGWVAAQPLNGLTLYPYLYDLGYIPGECPACGTSVIRLSSLVILSFLALPTLIGLLVGPVDGLLVALGTVAQGTIRPIGGLQWSWRGALRGLLTFGLGAGAITAVVWAFVPGSVGSSDALVSSALFTGGIVGLVFALAGAIGGGLTRGAIDERDLRRPNEGLRRSWRSAILGGEAVGLSIVGGVFLAYVLGQILTGGTLTIQEIVVGLLLTTAGGVVLGVPCALLFGGMAVIQNVALRRMLRRSRSIPRNFVAFLDFAADHVLLQRVGGSYRFIHALLADYFASTQESDGAVTPASEPSRSIGPQAGDTPQVPT